MRLKIATCLFILFAIIRKSSQLKYPDDGNEVEQRDITSLYRRNLLNLIRRLDDNVEPCDNFFQHVCNGPQPVEKPSDIFWSKQSAQQKVLNNDEDENEDIPPFLYNEEDRMRFYEEKIYEFKTRPGEILRDLYVDCKNRNVMHVGSATKQHSHWVRMLNEIEFLARRSYIFRQWPFLRFEWVTLTRRYKLNWVVLAAKFAAHGIPSLLRIFFAEGTIYIESAVQKSQNCYSLDEIEQSLVPLLGKKREQIASAIGLELWNFCNVLAGTVEPDFVLEYNDTTRIEEIFFQTFFTTLNLTEEEVEQARHIPIDLFELQRILELLLNADPRIVFNYILWHSFMELKYEDCYLLTKEFEDMLFSEYWHWHVFSRHFNRNVAMASYLFKTTRFQRHRKEILMSDDWDKFFFQKLVRRDFNIERMIRNYSNTYLKTDYLMEIYGEASLVNGYFYGNLLSLRRSKLRASFYQPFFDEENLNHPQYFLRQFLYFSILLLKQPFFHYFATQGFELWYASNLLYSSDGYLTALDCMQRQSLTHIINAESQEDDQPSIYVILTPNEIQEIFRFYAAFIESYRDYRFWLSGESFAFAEDFVLEYFRMHSFRMPFYATAQLYCNRNDLLYSSLINRSFMNLPEFAVAFNCSEESPMHPIVKCMNKS